MEIDRRAFIASLGGTAAVALMSSEQKADALEHYMEEQLDETIHDLLRSRVAEERHQAIPNGVRMSPGGRQRFGGDPQLHPPERAGGERDQQVLGQGETL